MANGYDAVVKRAVREFFPGKGPGVAVLVVEGGEVAYRQGHGLAQVAQGTPITPQTVFDLASVSKQFTAACVLLLVERGKLALTDPVQKHVPGFTMKPAGRAITLQDLLWHTSGLPDYTSEEWDDEEAFSRLTCAGLVKWLNQRKPLRKPGVRHEYNNSGYALLGRVVEEVSGERYRSFIEGNLFRPLGMTRTLASDDLEEEIPGRAQGYALRKKKPVPVSSPSVIQGDGNIFSCLDDLARWEAALREGTVLSKRSLRQAWTNGQTDDGEPLDDDGTGYGYGWIIGEACVWHNGSWAGTATGYSRWVEDGLTVIALSNLEDVDIDDFTEAITDAEGDDEEGPRSPGGDDGEE